MMKIHVCWKYLQKKHKQTSIVKLNYLIFELDETCNSWRLGVDGDLSGDSLSIDDETDGGGESPISIFGVACGMGCDGVGWMLPSLSVVVFHAASSSPVSASTNLLLGRRLSMAFCDDDVVLSDFSNYRKLYFTWKL